MKHLQQSTKHLVNLLNENYAAKSKQIVNQLYSYMKNTIQQKVKQFVKCAS